MTHLPSSSSLPPPAAPPRGFAVWARSLIGAVVSAVALWLALRGVQWAEVVASFHEANYGYVAAATALFGGVLALRTLRWRALFAGPSRPRLVSLFAALNIGYLVNNVLPLQVGEVARSYVVSDREGAPFARVLASIVVERLLDVVTLLVALAALATLLDLPTWARGPSIALGVGVVVALALGVVAARRRDQTLALSDWATTSLPPWASRLSRDVIHRALDAFDVL
ncbi:MAG: flippase-like domain-containing protein, partial [Dehalococcoidia bacterium]|nr:flippase-like domain-containing protein [Dehalococcoidia bacterium]